MAKTLLQLVQAATDELGITRPTAVIGNTDPQIIQLLALSNRVGEDLARSFEWRRLVKERVFETTAAASATGSIAVGGTVSALSSTSAFAVGQVVSGGPVQLWTEIASIPDSTSVVLNLGVATATSAVFTFATQDYSMPSDFDRMISDTNWDREDRWKNLGPKSSQEWQFLKSSAISTGPRYRFRIYGANLRVTPPPTAAITFAFEYVSNQWVIATGASAPSKTGFTADTDTNIFPDDLFVLGIKYQWNLAKGLDWLKLEKAFMDRADICQAQDVPVSRASLSPYLPDLLISELSVPDGNWPQT